MSVLDFMKQVAGRASGKQKLAKLRYVGKSKKRDTCDQCGKTGLAETTVFERGDGARVYLGSECAKGPRAQPKFNGFAIEKWLSYSGVYYREDQHIYPTEQAAKEEISRLEKAHGWQSPAPSYRIVPVKSGRSVDGAPGALKLVESELSAKDLDAAHITEGVVTVKSHSLSVADALAVLDSLLLPGTHPGRMLYDFVSQQTGVSARTIRSAYRARQKLESTDSAYGRAQALSQEQIDKFREMAYAQRGEPEEAMNRVQDAVDGGVPGLTYVVEHVGDLTNRMAKDIEFNSAGYAYVREKVESSKRSLGYMSKRAYEDQLRKAAERRVMSNEDYHKKIKLSLKDYANAHAELPVYNRAQWLARQAAIELGNECFASANITLGRLEDMLGSEEIWWQHATEYSPGGWKP